MSCLEKDVTYDDFKLVSEGITNINEEMWKRLRKPLNKLFNNKFIEASHSTFDYYGDSLCTILEKFAESAKEFNIKHITDRYALDTICRTHLNYELNELKNNKYNFSEKVESFLDNCMAGSLRPSRWIKCIYNRTSESIAMKKIAFEIRELMLNIIAFNIKQRELSKESEAEEIKSYSDILLNVGKPLNLDVDGLSHLGTDFLIGGYETTSVGLSSCLLALAMFPEYQEMVYKEQLEVMGYDLNRSPNKSDLAKMVFLERTILETYRLWCPIGIHRQARQNIVLNNKFTIPKGAAVLVSLYTLHRNSKYYERPFQFYPDHFLPEKIAERPKTAYLAFSTGPRGCPGKSYGLLSTKMLVSRIVRRFRIKTSLIFDNIEYLYRLMPEPKQGYMISLEKRPNKEF